MNNYYKQKKLLITGGMGFVGSNLAIEFKSKYPNYTISVFDNLKRRGSELNINRVKSKGIEFIHGDIRNKNDFDEIGHVDCVIDAAAEPSVLAGINSSPDYLIDTNLNGTINALNFAKKHNADFVFLSTSRIYPIDKLESIKFTENETRFEISPEQNLKGISLNGISEDFSTNGTRSFYGATKLASELFVNEFNRFAGIKTVINRCGIIAGPWQMGKVDQGVTALWLANHLFKKPLSYIGYGGKGKQVRDVLHITDLFDLIDWQIHNLEKISGETFNAGGGTNSNFSLNELTNLCQEITGNKIEIKSVAQTRNADIRIYLTDNSKIAGICKWQPQKSLRTLLIDTYNWMLENQDQLKSIL